MKELIEAFRSRLNTPLFFYALLAFLAWNWKPLLYLYAAEEEILVRILYFESNTSICTLAIIPLLFGLGWTIFYPWLNFCLAYLCKYPIDHRNNLLADTEHNLLAEKQRLKEERDNLSEIRLKNMKKEGLTAEGFKPTENDKTLLREVEDDLKKVPENEYSSEDLSYRALASEYDDENLVIAADYVYKAAQIEKDPIVKAQLLAKRGYLLGKNKQYDEAVNSFNDLLEFYKDSNIPQIQKIITSVLFYKGFAESELNNYQNALVTFNTLLNRCKNSSEPDIQQLKAKTTLNKGRILERLGKIEKTLEAYEELLNDLGDSSDPILQKYIAETLFQKGSILSRLKEYKAAVEVFEIFINRYEKSAEPEIQTLLGLVLFGKGFALNMLEDYTNALAVYEEFLNRFENSSELILQKNVAKAFNNVGLIFIFNLKNEEKAITIFDTLIRHFKGSNEIELQMQVAMAFHNKAGILTGEAAIEVQNEFLKYFENTTEPDLQIWVIRALYNKGTSLNALGKNDDAIVTYDSILNRFKETDKPEIQLIVVMTHTNKITSLVRKNKVIDKPRIITACDELLKLFENRAIPEEVQESVAQTYQIKTIALNDLKKDIEASLTFKTFLDRFANSSDPKIQDIVNTTIKLNWNWALEWVNQKLEVDSNNLALLDIKRHCLWEIGKFEESINISKLLVKTEHPNHCIAVLNLLEALALMKEEKEFELVFQKYKTEIEKNENYKFIMDYLLVLKSIASNDLTEAKAFLSKNIPDLSGSELDSYFYSLEPIWSFDVVNTFITKLDTPQQKEYLINLNKYFTGRLSSKQLKEFLSKN